MAPEYDMRNLDFASTERTASVPKTRNMPDKKFSFGTIPLEYDFSCLNLTTMQVRPRNCAKVNIQCTEQEMFHPPKLIP